MFEVHHFAEMQGKRIGLITNATGIDSHGVNPFDYLKDLFRRLPAAKSTEIGKFTPAAWVKAKEEVVVQVA